MAGARSFGFLSDALLFRIDGAQARRLGAGYRPSDITRQGRAERRYSGSRRRRGDAGIIPWQHGQPFRRGLVFGVVEFRPAAEGEGTLTIRFGIVPMADDEDTYEPRDRWRDTPKEEGGGWKDVE